MSYSISRSTALALEAVGYYGKYPNLGTNCAFTCAVRDSDTFYSGHEVTQAQKKYYALLNIQKKILKKSKKSVDTF